MSNEPLGIVEEGQRRRAVFDRYINRRLSTVMGTSSFRATVEKIVDARLKAEVDALIRSRMDRQRRELETLDPDSPHVPIRTIIEAVCDATGRTLNEILSPRRSRNLAWPRHVAMWLVRELRPDLSLPAIGRAFQRDHTSIMHGTAQVRRRREETPFKEWLEHPAILALLAPKAAK